MNPIESIWRTAKIERRIRLGPVSILFRLRRAISITGNRPRLSHYILESNGGFLEVRQFAQLTQTASVEGSDDLAQRVETALIFGVGPGFGFAVARKLVSSGMSVAMVSRDAERLRPLLKKLSSATDSKVRAYGCDATNEVSVRQTMARVAHELGTPHLVIYSIQGFSSGHLIDIEVAAFEDCWRQNCLGGFIVAREAARMLKPLGRGTIALIGSTSAVIGRAGHLNLAVGKFGLRALSQVMSQELWSSGIHVVHLIIDADIKEDESIPANIPQADPQHIADLLYTLHCQPKSAWTSEIDVRPWNERFWEHC